MDDEALYSDTPETEPPTSGHWRRQIDGKDRNTYRVLRQVFRNQCQAVRAVCHICEGAIDYLLPYGHPMAFELDHYVPVSVDESLALNPTNFRASHSQHNRMRGAGASVSAAADGWVKCFCTPGHGSPGCDLHGLDGPSDVW